MPKDYHQQERLKLEAADWREGPVECLGMTFPNDEERRSYFLEKLREKLKDPEFRKIEGFPIGSDEDILALSDPPYYVACPNPFICDFMEHYGKPYNPNEPYSREPYASDISEGKNDQIYIAHSYHTKVPYKAIMHYILHYTNPGDVVFDGFCGTGMTGLAAKLCASAEKVRELGYQVNSDGTVYEKTIDFNGNIGHVPISRIGHRNSIIGDLCPSATFIAYHFNTPLNPSDFSLLSEKSLDAAMEKCSWMFRTAIDPSDRQLKGTINYVLWSDVFLCP